MVDTDDTRRTMDDRRRTTPGVWHKLPTGELIKILSSLIGFVKCRAISYVQWGGCIYLRYRTEYEVEIQYAKLSDTL